MLIYVFIPRKRCDMDKSFPKSLFNFFWERIIRIEDDILKTTLQIKNRKQKNKPKKSLEQKLDSRIRCPATLLTFDINERGNRMPHT